MNAEHHLHHDPDVDDMLRAANARAEAAERRLADQQAAVKALADAWDERKHPGMVGIAKRVRAALSDPTALDALIARERAAALREAADAIGSRDERCAVRRTCHLADAITLRALADVAEAER